MKKRLFYVLLCTASVACWSCSRKGVSGKDTLAQSGEFDHESEKVVLTKVVNDEKPAVLSEAYDTLRCYLASNIRYDKVLDSVEEPKIWVSFIVNADCSITLPDDFASLGQLDEQSAEFKYMALFGKELKRQFDEQSAEFKYMEQEAKRVISSLKYEKPSMKYDSLTGQWVPTSEGIQILIDFRRNKAAELYNKDTILARMDWPYSNCIDGLVNRRFKQYTTDAEKIKLCRGNHSWATKVNALVGLVESGNPVYKKLLPLQLVDATPAWLNDDRVVRTGWPADIVLGQIIENKDHISAQDRACVDSIVLYSAVPRGIPKLELSERSTILAEMEPRPEYYERVREVWMKDTVPGALVLLAKYRREADFKFIMHTLEQYDETDNDRCLYAHNALNAVANWPDPRFVPAIEKIVESEAAKREGPNGGESLAKALLAYRNDWALGQLRKLLHQGDFWLTYECNAVFVRYVESHPDDDFSSNFRIVEKIQNLWELL